MKAMERPKIGIEKLSYAQQKYIELLENQIDQLEAERKLQEEEVLGLVNECSIHFKKWKWKFADTKLLTRKLKELFNH